MTRETRRRDFGRTLSICSAAALAPLTAACSTSIAAPLGSLSPIADALTLPIPELTTAAAAGRPDAQYALSVLAEHGLRGQPRDPNRARALRAASVQPRGDRRQAIYVPGVNGRPGHVQMFTTGSPTAVAHVRPLLDFCVAALASGTRGSGPSGPCGPPEVYEWLRARWTGADAEPPLVWRAAMEAPPPEVP